MINYYRAALRAKGPRVSSRVTVPTQIVWGVDDAFLGRELAEDSLAFCERGSVQYLDATHWVQHEVPQAIIGAIGDPSLRSG
jgi:epoxide hydrolase 4